MFLIKQFRSVLDSVGGDGGIWEPYRGTEHVSFLNVFWRHLLAKLSGVRRLAPHTITMSRLSLVD